MFENLTHFLILILFVFLFFFFSKKIKSLDPWVRENKKEKREILWGCYFIGKKKFFQMKINLIIWKFSNFLFYFFWNVILKYWNLFFSKKEIKFFLDSNSNKWKMDWLLQFLADWFTFLWIFFNSTHYSNFL